MSYRPYDDKVGFEDDHLDTFGRLRVSQPFPLFSSQLQFDKNPETWAEKAVGGASSLHLTNESAVRLSVGTANGDAMIRQTKKYFRYYPGRGQLVEMTGVLGPAGKTGVVSRIGYFDDKNGVFFESSQNGLYVVIRSSTTGTVVENRIHQSQWNMDKLDGNGASKSTIDPTKAQIFVMDFQWLGVGRVRMGFFVGQQIRYVHQFFHANITDGVYMGTANLPCRYEIRNIAATTSASSMKQICTVVLSEGGFVEGGLLRSFSLGANPKTIGSGVLMPLMSFRLNSTYARSQWNPLNYTILNTSNSYVRIVMLYNATLTGASWQAATPIVDADIASTAVSGGTAALEFYLSTRESAPISSNSGDNLFQMGADIDGVSDTLTIAAQGVGGTATVYSSMTWREIK